MLVLHISRYGEEFFDVYGALVCIYITWGAAYGSHTPEGHSLYVVDWVMWRFVCCFLWPPLTYVMNSNTHIYVYIGIVNFMYAVKHLNVMAGGYGVRDVMDGGTLNTTSHSVTHWGSISTSTNQFPVFALSLASNIMKGAFMSKRYDDIDTFVLDRFRG